MIPFQEPPPYVQYMSEAENLGRMGYAAGVCIRFRLLAGDEASVTAAGDEFQRRAVIARTWGPLVEQAITNGAAQERREFAFIADIPDNLPEAEAARRRLALEDFLVERCGWVLRHFPDVVSLPPDD